MRIGALFAVLVYTILAIFIGVWLIAIGIGYVDEKILIYFVQYLYTQEHLFYTFLSGIGLIFISFIFFNMSFGGPRRKKQVLFKNSSGEVAINLHSPVENVVKEVASQIKEIVEVRQDSYMLKKLLVIELRVVMRPGVKIKEISEDLQNRIIERIREVIGIDMPIKVIVRVSRVTEPKKKDIDSDDENVPIPFRNMDV